MQELEEIYIDTSNTLNVAIEGHALLLLTKVKQIQIVNYSSDLGDTAAVNAAIKLVYSVLGTIGPFLQYSVLHALVGKLENERK